MLLSDPYLTDQLIPYIGNKRKLLSMIRSAVNHTGLREGTFCDFFAGSGVVSRLAKRSGFSVIANDWEPYSYFTNRAYIEANHPPSFNGLGGIDNVFHSLNSLPPVAGYIANHYCPADDENPDLDRERMFYTQENGRRIDAIREQIKNWKASGQINEIEEAVLLAPLVYQSSYCSNTSGVFKAFHRGWGGATSTALYRIRSKLTLRPPLFFDNGKLNSVFREDAAELADLIECDIAYIDPPYNQHQYGSNYHLLNTIALWDKPEVSRFVLPGRGPRGKSAIRADWNVHRRSAYCSNSTAEIAFLELTARIRAKFVLVSYSTDGIIPTDRLLEILAERGHVSVLTRNYKRYRVSSQRPSLRSHTVEFVAVVDTTTTSRQGAVEKAVETIYSAGQVRQDG